MVYRGKVKNGKVVLENPKALPDGTDVEVRLVKKPGRRAKAQKDGRTLAQRLAPFIGKAKNLPPDMSLNLDHYLYGHPKRA